MATWHLARPLTVCALLQYFAYLWKLWVIPIGVPSLRLISQLIITRPDIHLSL